MSRTGNYRLDLQEHPAYSEGVFAAQSGQEREYHPYPIGSVERSAFTLGWDDAHDEARPRIES